MPEAQQQGQGQDWVASFSRLVLMYFVISYAFSPSNKPQIDGVDEKQKVVANAFENALPLQTPIDIRIFLSESEKFDESAVLSALQHWDIASKYGEEILWKEDLFLPASDEMRYNNGSLWIHISLSSKVMNEKQASLRFPSSFNASFRLNAFRPIKEKKKEQFLLSKRTESEYTTSPIPSSQPSEITIPSKYGSYWPSNFTFSLVSDEAKHIPHTLPPYVQSLISFERTSDGHGYYRPVIFHNTFWHLPDTFFLINETTESLPLHLEFNSMSSFKWQMYAHFDHSFSFQVSSMGSSETEIADMKRMFLETNPYFLGLTVLVTLLHTVFDFLAFKNDISFWKERKSMEGLSTRTVLLRTFCQFVIFLYLLDNETSWVILISSGIGVLIDLWKITKVFDVFIDRTYTIPRISLKDKQSYVSQTKEYDEQAMQYLSYILYPLIFCYAIYALVYETHKSWYSWLLSTLTGCVYTFGFIMMTPQIFINYKMKSVAHLPWRQLTYKFLNTIIDDLFAFIITMPILHRLACFRDDVIFLICLYQRWIYPVDAKRVNEFGSGGQPDEIVADPEVTAHQIEHEKADEKVKTD